MARMTDRAIAISNRATELAKNMLLPGDKLYIQRCGGIRSTVTFVRFVNYLGLPTGDLKWIETKSGSDDVHASHILRVNRKPLNFREIAEETLLAEGAIAPQGEEA